MNIEQVKKEVSKHGRNSTFPLYQVDILSDILSGLPDNPTIVEIGTNYARSTYAMSMIRSDAKIITIDRKNYIGDDNIGENVTKMIMDSAQAAREIDVAPDFIFVDGDHEYEGVKKDIESWTPKLKKGGIIAFHDFNNVNPAIDPDGVLINFGVFEAVTENITSDKFELLTPFDPKKTQIAIARKK